MEEQVNQKFLQPESILHLLKLPDVDKHRFNVYHTVDIVKDDIRNFFYNPASRVYEDEEMEEEELEDEQEEAQPMTPPEPVVTFAKEEQKEVQLPAEQPP